MNDFHGVYSRYASHLYRFALALTGNPGEAEDLVADAFVRLWAAPGEIREETVKAYLFTIVKNLFLSRRKVAARQVPIEESLPEDRPGVEQRAEARSNLAQVRKRLATLGDTDRAALVMRAAHGRSYEEIGGLLGLSAGAVRVRVHRVRLELAKAIGKTLGESS